MGCLQWCVLFAWDICGCVWRCWVWWFGMDGFLMGVCGVCLLFGVFGFDLVGGLVCLNLVYILIGLGWLVWFVGIGYV